LVENIEFNMWYVKTCVSRETNETGIYFVVCEDGGSSFAAVLFYGHEFTLLTFELLVFALIDLAFHNYFLDAAVTFFIMEASCFYS